MTVRARLTIRGQVQGVWYRGSMQEEARRLRVAGWVRNDPDGGVSAEVEGGQAAVDALVTWAHRGPSGARVSHVTVDWISPTGDEQGHFAIRR
jgi:acylphosphatase